MLKIRSFLFNLDIKNHYFSYALILFLISYFVLPTSKMVNNVYYLFLAVPALIYFFYTRFSFLKPNLGSVLWFAFFIIVAFSGFVSSSSAQFFKHILYVMIFVLVCMYLVNKSFFFSEKLFITSFWLVSAYVLLSAVYYWIVGKYEFGERVLWLPARMTGPIYTSMIISALFSLCLPIWVNNKRFLEFFCALAICLFNIMFVVQSRSGLVSLILVAAIYFAYVFYKAYGVKRSFFIFTLLLLSVLVFTFFIESIPVVNKLVARADSGRFELWIKLLEDFGNCSAFFGCGTDFESAATIGGSAPIAHPHNVFLSLLLYTGFLSLIIFLVICAYSLYLSFKHKSYWGLFLLSSMIGLNFDGGHLIGNPDELWMLLILPIVMIMNRTQSLTSE